MDVEAFRKSTALNAPPAGTEGPLKAMWHAARGEWDKAHAIVQDDESKDAAWVRAHLHRRKGEDAEAAKWYDKAGRSPSGFAAGPEWDEIAGALLLHI
jgi:hypothetical protein